MVNDDTSLGRYIDLGVLLKIPVLPLGFYVDGKFMIRFGKLDKNGDIGDFGLLLKSGVSLNFLNLLS